MSARSGGIMPASVGAAEPAGVPAAVVGGLLFNAFGAIGVTGFNLYSMLVAIIGAIVVLVIDHALAGRRAV